MIEDRRKRRWVPKHLDSGLWKDIPFARKDRILAEVPDYEEGKAYTQRELQLMTEKFLLDGDGPQVLDSMQYGARVRREAYGLIDENLEPGMYNRTDPEGRQWRSTDERQAGYGYYR